MNIFDIWFEQGGKKCFFCQHNDESKAKFDVDFLSKKWAVIPVYYTKRTPEGERSVRLATDL